MSQYLGTLTISAGVNTTFNSAPTQGAKALLIGNESGLTCTISMEGGGVQKTLYPGTVDWFDIRQGFSGTVKVSPAAILTNQSSFTASELIFDAIGLRDPEQPSMYPVTLPGRFAVNPTATGNPLFTATVGFGATANKNQILNIFNPPNSGVTFTFHSVRVFTNDSTTPTANLVYASGADNNYATAVSVVAHDGQGSPPTSAAHASAVDGGPLWNTGIEETLDMSQNVTQEFLAFPDQYTLHPGGNLLIQLRSGSSGMIVRLTMKWSEAAAVPTPQVTNMTTQTAANIVNDGNPVGTGLIEATPSDGSGQAIYATNDGQLTWKVDQSGTLHQVLKALTSGNPLQLGQVGDIAEFLGNLLIDGTLHGVGAATLDSTLTVTGEAVFSSDAKTNTIRDNSNGNVALDLSLGTGEVKFPQTIHPTSSTPINGTAGSYTKAFPFWDSGGKLMIVTFGGYSNNVTSTITFPSSMGRGIFFIFGLGGMSFTLSSGSVAVVLTLGTASAAGTEAAASTIRGDSMGYIATGVSGIVLSTATTQNGCIVFIGN